jgi:hypothetical protein
MNNKSIFLNNYDLKKKFSKDNISIMLDMWLLSSYAVRNQESLGKFSETKRSVKIDKNNYI